MKFIVSSGCLIFWMLIANAQSIIIRPRSIMVMRGNVFLMLKNAALVNNGTLIDSLGTVAFTGHKDTTFSYLDGTQSTTLYNLTVNKTAYGAALKTLTSVRNLLEVYGGILYADSNLILKSDISLTARVAAIPAPANIIGKAIVERFFAKKRAWRLVTSPLTNTPTIFDTWQNKGVFTTAINTCITGPGPTGAGGNGLDMSIQNNASMKRWNYATQALEPVLNTYNLLSPGSTGSADNTGYFLFVRGDRSFTNFTIPNTNNTTLSSNGKLQIGTQVFPASNTSAGFTLIGNPYASPVDFNFIIRNNLVKRFYVWDPTLNIVGAYVMLDDLDNDGIYTKSIAVSLQNNHLQSSQAFFVQTQNNGVADITFFESSKSTVNNNILFRPSSPTSPSNPAHTQSIRILLNQPQADSSSILADGILVECNEGYSDSVDLNDALKITNINENAGLLRYNQVLTVERRPLLSVTDTLFLKLSRTTQRKYQFTILPQDINDYTLQAWLQDSYLNSSNAISLTNASTYDFVVDANAASAIGNRFRIVFKQATVLPVAIMSINAFHQNQKNVVEWKVANEISIVKYEIEKSLDGIHFFAIGNMVTAANNGSVYQYHFADEQPVAGNNFYRIKYYEVNGQWKYTSIVKVICKAETVFNIYPNPIRDNIIFGQLINYPAGKYHLRLMTDAGQTMYETVIENTSASHSFSIKPTCYLAPSTYQLKIIGKNNIASIIKIMVAQ